MFKDFFVSARYLFGYLAPGVLWIGAAALVIMDNRTLKESLNSLSATTFILLVAVGFIVGNAMIGWSFWFAVGVSTLLHKLWDLVCFRKSRFVSPGVPPELISHVRRAIGERYGDDEYLAQLSGWELFDFCKKCVLHKSPVLGQQLLETESEVNLRAGFALPLLVFSGAWAWRGWTEMADLALSAFLLLIAWRLLETTNDVRRGEVHQGFECFLALQALDQNDEARS